MLFYLATSLQIQNERFSLGDGYPHFVPSLPFFKELEVAAEEAVFSCQDALLLEEVKRKKDKGKKSCFHRYLCGQNIQH